MKCGQTVLIEFPFTDKEGAKLRAAMVVSCDRFNERGDFIAVPISAQLFPNDQHVFKLDSNQPWFKAAGLRPASKCIRWSKLMTLNDARVLRTLGQMPSEQVAKINSLIRTMFE